MIRHLLREGMLEGVLRVRIERRLVEKLRPHERLQRGAELRLRLPGHALQDGLRELLPDHRGRLEHGLLPLAEAVDPRGQDGLHGGGEGEPLRRLHELIRAPRPLQAAALDQRLHDLLDEEGVPARALPDPLRESGERRIGTQEVAQQLGNRCRAERHQGELLVVGPLHPAGVVLGPEVHHEEVPRRR